MNLKALQRIGYGVYIVSSKKDGSINGQIANTVFQITSEPPTIAVSINKQNLTHGYIESSKVFAVSVLSKDAPMELIGRFGFKSGREVDKLNGIGHKIGVTGAPIVTDYALSYMECEVVNSLDVGTHTVFIGKVIDGDIIATGEPMTYAYYHQIKGGRSPKAAPTYIEEDSEEKPMASGSGKYHCKVCGYVYDPENGDPDSGIKPGTSFDALPDTWVCPICGAPKSEFEKEE
jgi:flavin reductase (DIM6/NTAB) family NADH-FMN oxidoreductase RutF/rubredoxin